MTPEETNDIIGRIQATVSAVEAAIQALRDGELSTADVLLRRAILGATWARIDVRELARVAKLDRDFGGGR